MEEAPISPSQADPVRLLPDPVFTGTERPGPAKSPWLVADEADCSGSDSPQNPYLSQEIGRASCRERV